MADSPVFNWASEFLQKDTGLSLLQCRGLVRLVLKEGGLDGRSLKAQELRAVGKMLLPKALERNGIWDGDRVCQRLLDSIPSEFASEIRESPQEIFRRLRDG